VRRIALLVSLVAVVAFTGTASGARDRTPRSVVESALLKVRPAADLSAFRPSKGNRVRVIVTLRDPPLAEASYGRRLAGPGTNRKLSLKTPFAHSYLSRLEAAQASAIASVQRAIPEAVVSRHYELLLNGFAVSVPYERLPKLLGMDVAMQVHHARALERDGVARAGGGLAQV